MAIIIIILKPRLKKIQLKCSLSFELVYGTSCNWDAAAGGNRKTKIPKFIIPITIIIIIC
jgi:hypothetical protein